MPTLYLDGVATGWQKGTLSIDDAVEERSSASFVIPDTAQTNSVTKGTPVTITDVDDAGNEIYAFSGVVESTSRRAIVTPDGGGIYVNVTCADNHWYADKRVVAEGYQGLTVGAIAQELVADKLREENVYDHPYPGHAVATSLANILGYWRLADGPTDDSWWGGTLSSTDGTDVGAPTYVNTAGASPVGDDNLGGYVDLDGTNDWIETGRGSNALGLYGNGEGFAVGAMVYADAAGAGSFRIIMNSGEASNLGAANGTQQWQMRVDSNDNVQFYHWTAATTFTITDAALPAHDQWVQVFAVVDYEATEVRLYIDGALAATTTNAAITETFEPVTNYPHIIGAASSTGGNEWDGRLAEILYAGRPFSDRDIERLHDQVGETTRIAAGTTLTNFVLNYQPVSEGFEELAELSGFDYFVDHYRTLHLHGRGEACCVAPFTVTDTNVLSGSADLSTEAPKYRNRQYVKGGKDKTTQQVEVTEADGEQRSFLVGFEISEEPTVEVETGVGTGTYTTQTIGIRGIDEGVQFYWSKGDFEVTQDEGETVVAAGRRVRISYVGQFSIVAISIDEDEQSNVRQLEKAGTGWVETVIEDASVDSRQQAFDVASSKLERFAQRGSTFQFTTRDPGLRPGQIVTINFARLGLASVEALVESVSSDDFNGIELRYSVSAVTGPVLQTWRQFFAKPAKKLVVPTERTNIGAEEIVTISELFSDTVTRNEGATPAVAVSCQLLTDPAPTLPFTLC